MTNGQVVNTSNELRANTLSAAPAPGRTFAGSVNVRCPETPLVMTGASGSVMGTPYPMVGMPPV